MKARFICKECGRAENAAMFINSTMISMMKSRRCFTCNFWRNLLEEDKSRGKHKFAIIDGNHYVLEEPSDDFFQGFGGREFTIRFFDGTTVKCSNLWHQGKIPEGFNIKDNAEFVE